MNSLLHHSSHRTAMATLPTTFSKVDSDKYAYASSFHAGLGIHCFVGETFASKTPTGVPKENSFCGVGSHELSIARIAPVFVVVRTFLIPVLPI